jgi:mono/diheme cytochrome c family protein
MIMPVKKTISLTITLLVLIGMTLMLVGGSRAQQDSLPAAKSQKAKAFDQQVNANVEEMMEAGRETFRNDTFGDESFWGDLLQLHKAIAGAGLGGVGAGVSPKTALAVGLKVDSDALPNRLIKDLEKGRVNLDDPATTLALLKLNAVVGVKGFFNPDGGLRSVGISCAVCHSTVDDSLAPGIGKRLDGWANRDLNVGAVVGLAPNLKPVADLLGVDEATVRAVLQAWGPGKFDAELFLDGKAFRPDGKSAATLIPPAFGLAGVNLHTWTGWGSVTHWNAFVANLEMHGQGTFYDPRLNDPVKFPIAARNGFGNVRATPDLITSKLAPLHFYQLALPAPAAPEGSFDKEAAARGQVIFNNKAQCATCHVPPIFTEPGWNMHKAAEIGIDDFQAKRSPDEAYRTSPLRGLWSHQKGGFYHDGRFATLREVVDHYNGFFKLSLSEQEKLDLVEYLKSL